MKLNRLPIRLPPLWLVSAALLAGTVALCIRTRSRSDILGFFTPAGHLQAIASDHRGVVLFFSDVPFGSAAGLSAQVVAATADEFDQAYEHLFDSPTKPTSFRFLGLRYVHGQINPTSQISWHFYAITIPYVAILIPLALLPLGRLRRWVIRKRRVLRGRCPDCGYDLRHSPERCPECEWGTYAGTGSPNGKSAADRTSAHLTRKRALLAGVLLLLVGSAVGLIAFRGKNVEARDLAAYTSAELRGTPVTSLEVRNGSFNDLVSALRHSSQYPIVEEQELSPPVTRAGAEIPVYVRVHDVSLSAALNITCTLANEPCDFRFSAGAVHIIPPAVEVHAYAIADLLQQLVPAARQAIRAQVPFDSENRISGFSSVEETRRRLLEQLIGEVTNHSDYPNGIFGDRALVVGPPSSQAMVRTLLREIIPAAIGTLPSTGHPVDHSDLDRPIPELDVQALNLAQALDVLQQKTHANLVIDWPSLEDYSDLKRDRPIRLRLWDTTVGQALEALFAVAGDYGSVNVTSADGIIFVGSSDVSGEIRIYDIRDLIEQVEKFERARQDWNQHLFQPTTRTSLDSTQDVIDQITKIIEDTVMPNSWRDNGGSVGRICELGGRLVIGQTPRNHRRVTQLLQALRTGGTKAGINIKQSLKRHLTDAALSR